MTEPKMVLVPEGSDGLVERLRFFAEHNDGPYGRCFAEAASRLAALQEEVERLRKDRDGLLDLYGKSKDELNALRSAVDGVTEAADIIASRAETAEARVRELEAGLREIEGFTQEHGGAAKTIRTIRPLLTPRGEWHYPHPALVDYIEEACWT